MEFRNICWWNCTKIKVCNSKMSIYKALINFKWTFCRKQKLRMLGLDSPKRIFQSWQVRPRDSGNWTTKQNQFVTIQVTVGSFSTKKQHNKKYQLAWQTVVETLDSESKLSATNWNLSKLNLYIFMATLVSLSSTFPLASCQFQLEIFFHHVWITFEWGRKVSADMV